MSQDKTEVQFTEAFWQDVYQRAGRVRDLAAAELVQAEEMVLGEEAEVLPLFTEPFWEKIRQRSDRVRAMALHDLHAAEQQLDLGRLQSRRPGWRPTPQAWARAQGFALALLATLALLPQVAPVLSWARIGAPDENPVQIDPIDSPDAPPGQASDSGRAQSSGGANSAQAAQAQGDGQPDGQPLPTGEDGLAGAASSEVVQGPGAGEGQAGSSSSGVDGVGALRSPDDIVAEALSPSSARISWTDRSSDEVGFEIQRDAESTQDRDSRSVAQDKTGFVWNELVPGSRECFRVRAVGGAAPSRWQPDSDTGFACATLPVPPSPTPSPVPSPEPSPQPSDPAPSPSAASPEPAAP